MYFKAVHGAVQLELVEDGKQAGLIALPPNSSWKCPALFIFGVLTAKSLRKCSKRVLTLSKQPEFVLLIQRVGNQVFLGDPSPWPLLELEVSCLEGDTSPQTFPQSLGVELTVGTKSELSNCNLSQFSLLLFVEKRRRCYC